jgi:hypothetical protein
MATGVKLNADIRPGDHWFIIDGTWFRYWYRFVTSTRRMAPPGPIDNLWMVSVVNSDKEKKIYKVINVKDKVTRLREDADREDGDFRRLPPQVWSFFEEWYGGGPPISFVGPDDSGADEIRAKYIADMKIHTDTLKIGRGKKKKTPPVMPHIPHWTDLDQWTVHMDGVVVKPKTRGDKTADEEDGKLPDIEEDVEEEDEEDEDEDDEGGLDEDEGRIDFIGDPKLLSPADKQRLEQEILHHHVSSNK